MILWLAIAAYPYPQSLLKMEAQKGHSIYRKDYKIISVDPTTTDVLVKRCSLAAEGISQ
jgi:hypothetical protein